MTSIHTGGGNVSIDNSIDRRNHNDHSIDNRHQTHTFDNRYQNIDQSKNVNLGGEAMAWAGRQHGHGNNNNDNNNNVNNENGCERGREAIGLVNREEEEKQEGLLALEYPGYAARAQAAVETVAASCRFDYANRVAPPANDNNNDNKDDNNDNNDNNENDEEKAHDLGHTDLHLVSRNEFEIEDDNNNNNQLSGLAALAREQLEASEQSIKDNKQGSGHGVKSNNKRDDNNNDDGSDDDDNDVLDDKLDDYVASISLNRKDSKTIGGNVSGKARFPCRSSHENEEFHEKSNLFNNSAKLKRKSKTKSNNNNNNDKSEEGLSTSSVADLDIGNATSLLNRKKTITIQLPACLNEIDEIMNDGSDNNNNNKNKINGSSRLSRTNKTKTNYDRSNTHVNNNSNVTNKYMLKRNSSHRHHNINNGVKPMPTDTGAAGAAPPGTGGSSMVLHGLSLHNGGLNSNSQHQLNRMNDKACSLSDMNSFVNGSSNPNERNMIENVKDSKIGQSNLKGQSHLKRRSSNVIGGRGAFDIDSTSMYGNMSNSNSNGLANVTNDLNNINISMFEDTLDGRLSSTDDEQDRGKHNKNMKNRMNMNHGGNKDQLKHIHSVGGNTRSNMIGVLSHSHSHSGQRSKQQRPQQGVFAGYGGAPYNLQHAMRESNKFDKRKGLNSEMAFASDSEIVSNKENNNNNNSPRLERNKKSHFLMHGNHNGKKTNKSNNNHNSNNNEMENEINFDDSGYVTPAPHDDDGDSTIATPRTTKSKSNKNSNNSMKHQSRRNNSHDRHSGSNSDDNSGGTDSDSGSGSDSTQFQHVRQYSKKRYDSDSHSDSHSDSESGSEDSVRSIDITNADSPMSRNSDYYYDIPSDKNKKTKASRTERVKKPCRKKKQSGGASSMRSKNKAAGTRNGHNRIDEIANGVSAKMTSKNSKNLPETGDTGIQKLEKVKSRHDIAGSQSCRMKDNKNHNNNNNEKCKHSQTSLVSSLGDGSLLGNDNDVKLKGFNVESDHFYGFKSSMSERSHRRMSNLTKLSNWNKIGEKSASPPRKNGPIDSSLFAGSLEHIDPYKRSGNEFTGDCEKQIGSISGEKERMSNSKGDHGFKYEEYGNDDHLLSSYPSNHSNDCHNSSEQDMLGMNANGKSFGKENGKQMDQAINKAPDKYHFENHSSHLNRNINASGKHSTQHGKRKTFAFTSNTTNNYSKGGNNTTNNNNNYNENNNEIDSEIELASPQKKRRKLNKKVK